MADKRESKSHHTVTLTQPRPTKHASPWRGERPKEPRESNIPCAPADTVQRSKIPVTPISRLLILLFGAHLTSGCMVGPNYSQPEIPTPDTWNQTIRGDVSSSRSDISGWWRRFHDPTLNKLIGLAASSNRELIIAAERIEESRAFEGVARGGLFPYASASGSISRNRNSGNVSVAPSSNNTLYDAGIGAGWELDFVGGLRRSLEAARANTAATEELYRDAMVIIYASVAESYIDYRTLQERIRVVQNNIDLQSQSVELTEGNLAAGLAPEIDVSQAKANLADSRAQVPSLQIQLAQTLNRLAVLVGSYPDEVEPVLGSGGIPDIGHAASVGIPADLLRSRPDIRAAERQLAARTAEVGVAEAELYPKFDLLGTFALQSTSSADFFNSSSGFYSFGPSFRWRIFEAGRIREQIKASESGVRQSHANYEQTVLQAVSEVETALASIAYEEARLGHLQESRKNARRTSELIIGNYTNDVVDFQNVVDAQRTVLFAEEGVVISRGQRARSHVALYRALGGGTDMSSAKGGADEH